MHPIAQWANSLEINGFNDWYIPSKDELNHLFKNAPNLFEKKWYWSSTQHTESTSKVWICSTTGENKEYHDKRDITHARAVRRSPFSHSDFNFYDECEGGFYAGKHTIDGIDYALIVSPKEQGETVIQWKEDNTETAWAYSEENGLTNTLSMLEADKNKKSTIDAIDLEKRNFPISKINNILNREKITVREPVTHLSGQKELPSIYHRKIKGVAVDIYDLLDAYGVTNHAAAHAFKKVIMSGNRGYKDVIQDYKEAIASLQRAIEQEEGKL